MTDRCRWVDDPQAGPVFIPGCSAAGYLGEDACDCEGGPGGIEEYRTLASLEAKLDRIVAMVEQLLARGSE